MTVADLRRSTPLRLAIAFAGLFSLAMAAILLLLYWQVGVGLDHHLMRRLVEAHDALALVGRRDGLADLTTVVQSESASIRDSDAIFALVDASGRTLAGNTTAIEPFSGFRQLDRAAIPEMAARGTGADRFLAAWQDVPGGKLLIGLSNRETLAAQRSILAALGWALVLAFALAGGVGGFLAQRASRRVAAFSRTLEAVSRGKLDERVPLSRRDDDLDRIGGQLNEALDQLRLLVERVKNASADIAHELKSPIGRLRQHLERVADDPGLGEDQRREIRVAVQESERVVAIIEALLRIGEIEAGARKSRFAPLSLSELIADVAEIYAPVAEEAGQHLVLARELAGPATVLGDRELLTQAIANIIENAICHCPRGIVTTVALGGTRAAPVLRIADTGPGIPEAGLARITERFHRLDRSRTTPGNGLGLSLVAVIADLHDARLAFADNRPGLAVSMAFPAMGR